ncbi:hypothetical protein RHSIM_Rhsim09G0204100 [Rhododendron simsii]|uniref:Uncharacterized protein n=1 Tax=Rhododendron simsii TaxID=118357 RepID=A0A834GE53_RHOSS|nr:hypothetical protein RHSIM_Rhsim09G0204100 [Rhododendron simsii]
MVKLASARECRMYGPRRGRNRAEYINAALYVFATIVQLCGFVFLLLNEPEPGLVLLLIALGLVVVVNVHDLLAHLAGIDYWFPLMGFDPQLGLVEFAVPFAQALGALLTFLGILFLFIQSIKGYVEYKLEKHALNLLLAGSIFWLFGAINNACQIYERANGHVQILQESVHIPFLMGSCLFLVGAILNSHEQARSIHHGLELLGWTWVWFGIFGSMMFFIGGLANVVKIFKMQQMDGTRLEKLRGGAQERLVQGREGRSPLILEEERRRRGAEEGRSGVGPSPYKDVLVRDA